MSAADWNVDSDSGSNVSPTEIQQALAQPQAPKATPAPVPAPASSSAPHRRKKGTPVRHGAPHAGKNRLRPGDVDLTQPDTAPTPARANGHKAPPTAPPAPSKPDLPAQDDSDPNMEHKDQDKVKDKVKDIPREYPGNRGISAYLQFQAAYPKRPKGVDAKAYSEQRIQAYRNMTKQDLAPYEALARDFREWKAEAIKRGYIEPDKRRGSGKASKASKRRPEHTPPSRKKRSSKSHKTHRGDAPARGARKKGKKPSFLPQTQEGAERREAYFNVVDNVRTVLQELEQLGSLDPLVQQLYKLAKHSAIAVAMDPDVASSRYVTKLMQLAERVYDTAQQQRQDLERKQEEEAREKAKQKKKAKRKKPARKQEVLSASSGSDYSAEDEEEDEEMSESVYSDGSW